jgi:hypothetical protein
VIGRILEWIDPTPRIRQGRVAMGDVAYPTPPPPPPQVIMGEPTMGKPAANE